MTNGRPKVLMLTPYVPAPPESGGRRRTHALLRRLAPEFDVTLACLARPSEPADVSDLREHCEPHLVSRRESPSRFEAGARTISSPLPLTMQLYRSPGLRRLAASLAEGNDFTAVHVESFYMLQNVPRVLEDRVVLVEPDIESRAWTRYAKVARPRAARPLVALEAGKSRCFERRAWRRARLVGLVSEVDRERVARLEPSVATFVAPNGVDESFFELANREPAPATGVFLGDYKYLPNVDAAEHLVGELLPRVLRKTPGFRLWLAGKDPPGRVRHLGRHSAVDVVGRVDDVRDVLRSASVFVCPLRAGSGTRLKILEAMACGLPVVTTSVGCEGLDVEPGRHLIVADEPEVFAESVVALLLDPARADALGSEGRAWAEEHASWSTAARALAAAYARVASLDSSGGTSRRQS